MSVKQGEDAALDSGPNLSTSKDLRARKSAKDSFEQVLLRLKACLGVATDAEVAAALGMGEKAFGSRKVRKDFPVLHLKSLAFDQPDLGIDVGYVLSGVSSAGKVKGSSEPETEGFRLESFEQVSMRAKVLLGVTSDRGLAAVLGMGDKAFAARKRRNNFPRSNLRALAAREPGRRIDVDYILTGLHGARVKFPSTDVEALFQDMSTSNLLFALRVGFEVLALKLSDGSNVTSGLGADFGFHPTATPFDALAKFEPKSAKQKGCMEANHWKQRQGRA